MGSVCLVWNCVSPVPCRDMQNSTGNMELLPSGNCSLFTVVPACVHDIAQLGRYLEFLGFISDQSCAQSLVNKDEKHYIAWWTIVRSEEYCLRKLMLMEHVAWAVPPAWHTCRVELWGWISLLCCSMEGRAVYGVPRTHFPWGAQENMCLWPCASAGSKLLCFSMASEGWPGWLWMQHVCPSPSSSFAYFYIFGAGKRFNSVLPLPSTAVTVLTLISPFLTLKVWIKDDILWQGYGPKGHLSFQEFYPTGSFPER